MGSSANDDQMPANRTNAQINIAAYGTLRKGGQYHAVLGDDAVLLGICRLTGWALHHNQQAGYPYAVQIGTTDATSDQNGITAEIWSIAANYFAAVDELEEYPQYYQRTEIDTPLGVKAWLYFANPNTAAGHPLIEHGDWARIDPNIIAGKEISIGETSPQSMKGLS